ncbi:MAG: gluconate 2-dehydrogenase subunit 3 family protein [Acidobacteriota bacterium]
MTLDEREWTFLDVLAARIAPDTERLDAAGRQRFRAIVEKALALRSPAMVRQVRLFLRVLRTAPVARYGRRFERLAPERQDAVLRWFQDARVQKLRQGLWGVKALVFMGYYAQPEVTPSLGYAPSFDGNSRLHA